MDLNIPLVQLVRNDTKDRYGINWYEGPNKRKYMNVTGILTWASAKGLANWRTRNTANQQEKISRPKRDRGLRFDRLVHKYLRGEEVEPDEDLKLIWCNFLKLKIEHRIESYKQNFVVKSDTCGFAGEADDLATIMGEPVILDWKVGKKRNTHDLQTAAYRFAAMEGGINVPKLGTAVAVVEDDFCKLYRTKAVDQTTHAFAAIFDFVKYDMYYTLKEMEWPWLGTWATELMEVPDGSF